MGRNSKLPPVSQWNFWSGVVICIITIGGFVLGTWYLMNVLEDEQQVPLARFSVQGELVQTDVVAIRNAILAEPLGSFFTADVDRIRTRIEALPWVKQASLRKVWPDRLSVYVTEQNPLAHWNGDRLLNADGEVFSAELDETKLSKALPHLFGPEREVEQTLTAYRDLQGLLTLNGLSISALRLTDRFSVSLVLKSGIELKLGREATAERVKRFIDLLPKIKSHPNNEKQRIEVVDLRYDTGVAVSWQPKEAKES
ncbi:cell division protein FtsQ [Idiomarina fontislapidosi]|uniref:Cell division protein FtsQ n=1 Tax=Idiomarina fontislapidosi TaxID=263723 RepID=A0A432Y2E6_9GAMM|nr:cell division protein FtsQ/DivIB [Idiomarina fontislapidosi]PYE33280.1 cell division protein FtsQ [Idiomarina fontislapidosi]RUO55117.1 cell division protein DivIVA [Idiomarina fontislapidosi]